MSSVIMKLVVCVYVNTWQTFRLPSSSVESAWGQSSLNFVDTDRDYSEFNRDPKSASPINVAN